ncbi:2-isopropylmalate synthase / (R)-citramalate synthase [Natronomonas pharaonis DSM 2160]|uniref:2-isopropylmalate synthase / (R)-citramalate synthase n=1 Tax=Natronomonas pharaonis (strain ATCC 35678 / DSM 2160 / CIP 103997 / JCM 8858 / NBRC 14720 / NCIMB 2260 / Gabara) TaxID=348780 RepID=A0A1U7ETY9_NATPD|nr:(R)-citramalate synthase [Natronomonas pharaonis]CAI48403.1 2-isopropylmalate synthase / (R)-citramalate synthase [Natronomonas pharaonis DSM 2160]
MTTLFGDHPATAPLEDQDVQFLDTTLRDGEQAPGISLTPEEKADIARELDAANVSVIEAGSACTGPGERETIARVADLGLDARVTSFARGVKNDIDLAVDCGVDGVNLVVPASDRHVEQKVDTTHDAVVEKTVELVEYATDHGLWVEVLGEDGSRADLDFLEELMGAAIDAGADRICAPDTVGHATPDRMLDIYARLSELGPTSTHTHDDLGLAVTNALVGVAAGADLVHGTINGIGERAGNVAIEEVAIALDHGYGVETLETERLYDLGQLVSTKTGVPLAPNKAVVGENAFTHESGIHTDGTLKDDAMYEPYPPEKVGRERRLVLGKHAGRAGVEAALAEHDIEVTDDELSEVVDRVKRLGDRGKRVTDADLLTIAEEVQGREHDRRVELVDLTAASGSGTPTASVRLEVDGTERVASGTGSGPVDAAIAAVRSALGSAADAQLESYHVDAITGGTDAVVTVEVEMSRNDRTVTVAASDSDITTASVRAMVDALDRLLADESEPVLADD